MIEPTIYGYIKAEETRFESSEVRVGDNWNWSFRNHVQMIFHLKNGVFYTGSNDYLRALKNIMEPVLNLSYWSEDIELKDVVFYTDGQNDRVKSFLLKKYHEEVYARENNLDELFDEITESDIDYGGVLVQKTAEPKPEVLRLLKIAFCDQTDMLGGPVALKHQFSPSKLRKMASFGWGLESNGATISINDLIILADAQQEPAGMKGTKNQTTGKTIEVYITRGDMPQGYLDDGDNMEDYLPQLHVTAFYVDKDKKTQGVTLYRKEDVGENLKFFTSKEVENRALGRGVGEGVLHPQIWTNFLEIHKMNMLEAGSKVPLYTDDDGYSNKNKIQDMENLEITTIQEGKRIFQVPTVAPANIQLFDKAINEWYEQAQLSGAAFDPLMGVQAASGTTFKGQERVVQQGRGSHERRRGKRSKFIEELYRDWIIPEMKKQILSGVKFISELSLKDLNYVVDAVTESSFENYQKELVLSGQLPPDPQTLQAMKQKFAQDFRKKGNKHLLEILKEDFKGVEITMGINVAAKQKDLAGMSDRIMGVIQTITANPYLIKMEPLMQLFNELIEYSGLQPIDMSGFDVPPMPTRRMTESIDYKDLATPPNDAQKQMLQLAGIQSDQQFNTPPPIPQK